MTPATPTSAPMASRTSRCSQRPMPGTRPMLSARSPALPARRSPSTSTPTRRPTPPATVRADLPRLDYRDHRCERRRQLQVPALAASVPGQWMSATATDPVGNTSEFSQDVQVINVTTTTTLSSSASPPRVRAGPDPHRRGHRQRGIGHTRRASHFVDTTTGNDLGAVALANGNGLPEHHLAAGGNPA